MIWTPAPWMAAEDIEAEEQLVRALRAELVAARGAYERAETASDQTAVSWRVSARIKDHLEAAARFDALAPSPEAA